MLTATTTAWGDGDTVPVVLQRIADNDPYVEAVELSIGAKTCPGTIEAIEQWSQRWVFLAHHAAPVTDSGALRPDLYADPVAAARLFDRVGIRRYSAHPPNRKLATTSEMTDWALRWAEALADHGIAFAVETMYVPRTSQEMSASGGYHLCTPAEVWAFVADAERRGWVAPLLIDASHLHIGVHGGQWTVEDVNELLAHGPCDELHLSTNDGRRDDHLPADGSAVVRAWVEPHLHRFRWLVDEGRRRRRYGHGHVLRRSSAHL